MKIQLDRKQQEGVVIIEAMIAILLFSLGILALVGLQASMVRNNSDTKYRADATYEVQRMIGDMWANPAGIQAILNQGTISIASLPNGTITVTQPVTVSEYQITVTWKSPSDTETHNYTVYTSVAGG